MVDLLFSWRFIEILRYKQMACIKPLTENCICTFDMVHHGSDQSKPHSILKRKHSFFLFTLFLFLLSLWRNKVNLTKKSNVVNLLFSWRFIEDLRYKQTACIKPLIENCICISNMVHHGSDQSKPHSIFKRKHSFFVFTLFLFLLSLWRNKVNLTKKSNVVNLLFSWRFIEDLRYKQTACIKPLTENCICTSDMVHHGSDQSKPHSIFKRKHSFFLFTLFLFLLSLWRNKVNLTKKSNVVNLLFSWRFIEDLRYKQTACIKPLTENCICTSDMVHHGSDQSKPHSIFKRKHSFFLFTLFLFLLSLWRNKVNLTKKSNVVNLLFSWRFIEDLRYKQTACIKPLTENCICTSDMVHHGSDQSKPHSIFKRKHSFCSHSFRSFCLYGETE